jgi:rare lipoprotein A
VNFSRFSWLGVVVAAALLSACAEAQLASHAVKVADPAPQQQKTDAAAKPGNYKVGKPYQIEGVWYYPAEDYSYAETGIASWYGPDFHGKYTANGELYDMNDLTAAHRTLPMPSLVRVTNLDNGRSIVIRVNDRGPFARGRIIDVSRRSAQLLGFENVGTAKVRVEILADESRQIAALARRTPGPDDEKPSAAPVGQVAVQTLAPPPGATAAPPPAPQAARPTYSAPPPQTSASGRPVANPPPPAVAAQDPARPNATQAQVAAATQPSPSATDAPAATSSTTGQVTVVPVQATNIYVQAGAFSNPQNAQRLGNTLSTIAPTQLSYVLVGTTAMYRVRLGPAASVADADSMLARVVAAGYPEARIVVD